MILVYVETDAAGQVQLTSAEALTFARTNAEVLTRLATSLPQLPDGVPATSRHVAETPSGSSGRDDGVEVALVGELTEDAVEQLSRLGVSIIHRLEHPDLQSYSAAAWGRAILDIAPESGTVLASGTPRGMELMAHLAVRAGERMAANVVAVDDEGLLRQVHGGTAFERLRLDGELQVLTVAGHACSPEEVTPTTPEIVDYELEIAEADLRTALVRTEVETTDDTSGLTQARAVVGAGRGVGSETGFGEVLELVDHLGGALGVSRVVTGLGWRPHSEQVGQTGSRISPDVYIACGISGAIQHMAGIDGAKTLIAINTDEESTMVQRADYAIIGDLHEVVGAVNEEIVRRRG